MGGFKIYMRRMFQSAPPSRVQPQNMSPVMFPPQKKKKKMKNRKKELRDAKIIYTCIFKVYDNRALYPQEREKIFGCN